LEVLPETKKDGDGTHVLTTHRELFNFSGVTHLAQLIPQGATDNMLASNFELEAEATAHRTTFRLYTNPDAYPKAFFVANAIYVAAADDIRAALSSPKFRLDRTIYVSGPIPPPDEQLTSQQGRSTVTVVKYTDTEVVVSVDTSQPGWLVVNDTNAPQWQVTVDGETQHYYVANTLFKTVFVPGGVHEVRWLYDSPAITRATQATLAGLVLLVLLQLPYHLVRKVKIKSKR